MSQQLMVVDREELQTLIVTAVRNALDGQSPAAKPNDCALTAKQLCELYRISRPSLWKLRKKGLPSFLIGDSPRFDRAAVHAWLTSNQSER